ncbi:efflux transporter outer membrane subunit [Scleromatobacter humisilvae]|uniref:Efflux transporter outer membrane subunit n=1 Tax=Scleromatobacter humisilvae TaxID=2897159 RepID=A0A9X1YSA9_9BURK|nr:efflux transporter outer membrane subunit [Scleromatobacter humisilvae]MCK9688191.1 efflux transporter outer membrane subunit [Scleromatobacter humisilvae]
MKTLLLKPIAIAAAACLLAACSTMAPHYERPAAPVAASFPSAAASAAAPTTGVAPAAQPWQAYFQDARLAQLIATALANNRDLRVSVLNIEVARAQVGLTRASEFPTVNVQGTHTRETGIQTIDTVGLAVAGYELDLWGRVRSLTDAALAQLSATTEARKAAQISLIASVANAYYAMAGDQALLEVAEQTLRTRTDTLKLYQLRFDNGVASSIDLQLNKSLVETARVAYVSAKRQRALDEDALVLLIGQPLPAQLPAAPAWDKMALPDVPTDLSSDVLLKRPDVLQAEQQLIAANADIGAARAAFFPTITLTGSYGTASTKLSGLFDHSAWTFIPQVTLPIFDAGRNRNNLRVSEAQRDIATAQYEKAVQSAFRDVADALAGRATLVDQLAAQQAETDAEAERFKLSNLLYTNGVASSLDLLDAQRSLFTSQQLLVQAKLALLQNRIAVYRALGGGWTEAAAPAS